MLIRMPSTSFLVTEDHTPCPEEYNIVAAYEGCVQAVENVAWPTRVSVCMGSCFRKNKVCDVLNGPVVNVFQLPTFNLLAPLFPIP